MINQYCSSILGLITLVFPFLFTDILGSVLKDDSFEMISVHNIQYNFGDRIVFSMETSVQNIPLEEVTYWPFNLALI